MCRYLKAAGDRPTRTGPSSAIGTAAHGLVTDSAEFNALLEKTGKGTKAIEERIGHTSIKVDDIYTTIYSEQQADAVNAIPEALRLAMSLLPAGFEPAGEQIAEEERRHQEDWARSRRGVGGRKTELDKA